MIRKFDGSYGTIKKTMPLPSVKPLEERIEHKEIGVDGIKIVSAFENETERFEKERDRSPGPAKYEPREPVYIQ